MTAVSPSQVLVDRRDRAGRGLLAPVQRLGQQGEALPELEGVGETGCAAIEVQTLGAGPAEQRGLVRQEIGWGNGPSAGRVHEVEPDGVAQQDKLGLGHY